MTFHEAAVLWVARLLGVPAPWVSAVALVLVGALAAWVVQFVLRLLADRLASRTSTDLDDILLRTSATPAALTVLLAAVLAAAAFVFPSPEAELTRSRLWPSGIVVIWGFALATIIGHALRRATRHMPGLAQTRGAALLGRFAKVFVAVVILLTLFGLWEVDVTPLVASAGLVGIALALAAQDTLSNFFAGLAVYMDRLYEPGDYVVLDQGNSGEIRGEVRDVGMRSTRILTRDDVMVVVPNSIIANGRVVNETGIAAQYRIRVGVSVAYGTDVDLVEDTLTRIAVDHPLVLPAPAPRARLRLFGESGIDWELLAWIRDPRDRGLVMHEMSKSIVKAFKQAGIVIPFPQRDLHIIKENQGEETPDALT